MQLSLLLSRGFAVGVAECINLLACLHVTQRYGPQFRLYLAGSWCQKLVCSKTESPPVATHALQVVEQVLFQKCVKGGQPGKWSSQIGIPLHNFTGGASTS